MPNVNPFATEEQWVAAGSPGGDYAAWLKSIGYGPDGNPVASAATESKPGDTGGFTADPRASGDRSPMSFEQRLAGGEFSDPATAIQLEVRRRRNLLTDNHGMKDLPPDVADLVLRDASGKVRKARSSTTQSALGAAFDSKASLFGER